MIVGEKANKDTVNYRNMASCNNCGNYNSAVANCKIVDGGWLE